MVKTLLILLAIFTMTPAVAESDQWKALYRFHSKMAEQGNAEAQYKLGEMNEEGRGTATDYQAARKWYEKAAEKGHSGAAYKLGMLYEQGLGMPANRQKARDWYERAALQGNHDAQQHLRRWDSQPAPPSQTQDGGLKQRAEQEERASQAALKEQRAAEQERKRRAQLAKQRAKRERERQLARERAQKERARRAAEAKERAEAEKARQEMPVNNPSGEADTDTVVEVTSDPSQVEAEVQAEIDNTDGARDEAETAAGEKNESFEADPCKSPAARFMSTCRDR